MYSDVFCKVYHEFGWNYYPEAFAEQLLQWLRQRNVMPRSSLDLACGTGVLCGGSCDGANDHRMVMSAALGALIAQADVTVTDRDAIRKSYPGFYDDFSAFGICDADTFR